MAATVASPDKALFATSLMTPAMQKEQPPVKTKKMGGLSSKPDEGWGDKLSQRHVPGYAGCVPDITAWGTGSSFSEGTYKLAGNYPNKLDAPAGVAKPKIWDSVATNDYVSHTSDEVHRSNAGMASAGQQSDVSIGVPLGGFDFGEVDTKGVATIDKDHPSRRSGPQTLLGPNDTTSARDLYNHTFTNQMTFSMKNLQMAETNRAAQPLTGKTSWPELVGLDGLEAKRVIQREAGPKIKIELIPRGSRIAEDVKTNRVRIFVRADNNKVAAAPRIA